MVVERRGGGAELGSASGMEEWRDIRESLFSLVITIIITCSKIIVVFVVVVVVVTTSLNTYIPSHPVAAGCTRKIPQANTLTIHHRSLARVLFLYY